jgi:hypothetical protein
MSNCKASKGIKFLTLKDAMNPSPTSRLKIEKGLEALSLLHSFSSLMPVLSGGVSIAPRVVTKSRSKYTKFIWITKEKNLTEKQEKSFQNSKIKNLRR